MEKNQKHLNKGALKEIAVIQNSTIIDSTIYPYLTTSYISSGRHDENRVSIVPSKKVKKIYLYLTGRISTNDYNNAQGNVELKVDDEYVFNIPHGTPGGNASYNNLLKTKNSIGKIDIYTNSNSPDSGTARINIIDLKVYV